MLSILHWRDMVRVIPTRDWPYGCNTFKSVANTFKYRKLILAIYSALHFSNSIANTCKSIYNNCQCILYYLIIRLS